ncbi:hypothetical protein AVEN_260456-1 [Araneus ventricosus]|uniref:Uncharacterized protein n=1 Tax=Araneus ventricosus TaxID=182803 RepID=A0A4Y2KX33_ARAVE|nr:hypothetical protein AVEN_260456-1 [Araneus ventricosus]
MRLISVHPCRRRTEQACDSRLSARRRHWTYAAQPGTFSDAGIDGRRWEQDRDHRRDDRTLHSRTAAAVVLARVTIATAKMPDIFENDRRSCRVDALHASMPVGDILNTSCDCFN